MDRRRFLMASGAGLALAAGGKAWAQSGARPLPLIPMTDLTGGIEERISLTLNPATHDFGTGAASETYGINNNYLGPVLRVKQGQTLPFDVTNNIGDTSTIHWPCKSEPSI